MCMSNNENTLWLHKSTQIHVPLLLFTSPYSLNVVKGHAYIIQPSSVNRSGVHDHRPTNSTLMYSLWWQNYWLAFNSLHNLFFLMFFLACLQHHDGESYVPDISEVVDDAVNIAYTTGISHTKVSISICVHRLFMLKSLFIQI